ncbi:MAG: glycerol-3-phosphate acyltransferase [Anaerolineales bacterium]|nr:glycerol-3-phosphate acyltransferase [Anaerolineales bacterium]
MEPLQILVVAILSYLIGSISFSRIVSKIVDPNVDLDSVDLPAADGSTHRLKMVGATTASVKLGPKVGCTIGILDILKGFLPVLALKLFFPNDYYHLISAVFVVVGHNFPIFYKFKGGVGISSIYGGFFVVDFLGIVVSTLVSLVLGFFVIRDMIVAYVSGVWLMLVWLIIFKGDWPHIIYGIVINVIFILGFVPEIKAYIAQKQKGEIDMQETMRITPMGRGMLKIMDYFGLNKPEGD